MNTATRSTGRSLWVATRALLLFTVVLGIVVYFIISAIIGSISMMFIASTAAMSGLAGL